MARRITVEGFRGINRHLNYDTANFWASETKGNAESLRMLSNKATTPNDKRGFRKESGALYTGVRQLKKDYSTTGQTMDSKTRQKMKNHYNYLSRKASGASVG